MYTNSDRVGELWNIQSDRQTCEIYIVEEADQTESDSLGHLK